MDPRLLDKLVAAGVLTPTPCHGAGVDTVSNAGMLPDPLWEHDCDACLFLGTFNNADLYLCPAEAGGATVISRFSSEGGNYASGMVIASRRPFDRATHRELRVAYLIAKDCGLIKEEEEEED